MPLDPSFVGRTYPPHGSYEVGREKVREFAVATGDESQAFHDPAAAGALGRGDVVAPPTFAVVLSLAAAERVLRDPDLGLDWGRVVHAEQRFAYARPLVSGDRLQVTTTIDAIRSVGGNDMLTVRGDIGTVDGEHVLTATSVLVARAAPTGREA
ncbi:MAG: MaoC family dehydratase N-terminal domain-containing protein [Actinomycetota bacterium]|nr:MaoC family dehydratase N-terminal domain-containing protein [Actinomycetota bacterium]